MASDLPSSDFITSTTDSQCLSEDSQTTRDTLSDLKPLDDEELPLQISQSLSENEQRATTSHVSSVHQIENNRNSSTSITNSNYGISQASKYDALAATLADLQSTQVSNIRQLHRHMLLKTRANADILSSASQATYQSLPSIAAHTISNPPLTASQTADVTSFAHNIILEHIRLLQQYNQIRDVGQGLIGIVADRRNVRVRDCQEEFGVTDGD